jgi:hypothetical protein
MSAVDDVWREVIIFLRVDPWAEITISWNYLKNKGIEPEEFEALATPDLAWGRGERCTVVWVASWARPPKRKEVG